MTYFICCREDAAVDVPPDIMAEQDAYLAAHRHRVRAGGPLVDEATNDANGYVMFADMASREEAEAFVRDQPYVLLGRTPVPIVRRMAIRMLG